MILSGPIKAVYLQLRLQITLCAYLYRLFILKKLILILFAAYFLLGSSLLPCGYFAALAELPAMYHHCQTTEDPDMNFADFITEHLLNMDDTADSAEEADEHELPHNPLPFHTISTPVFFCIMETAIIPVVIERPVVKTSTNYIDPYFPSVALNKIFQPPRVLMYFS